MNLDLNSRLRNDYRPRHGRPDMCQAALDLANAYVKAVARAVR